MISKTGNMIDDQETIINIDPPQLGKKTTVYTTIPSDLKKMWNLHEKYPDDVKIIHDDKYGTEFEVPRKWVTVRRPRTLSEEERQKAAERLAQYRPSADDNDD